MSQEDEQIVDEQREVTDQDLADLKASAESKEGVEVGKPDEPSKEYDGQEAEKPNGLEKPQGSEEPKGSEEELGTPTFTKEFPNIKGETPEEYIKNLEIAYKNSTSEAMRLKMAGDTKPSEASDDPAVDYARTMMQRDSTDAFNKMAEKYPQIREMESFEQFRKAVEGVSTALATVEGKIPTYLDIYQKTADVLGWEPIDTQERLGTVVKDSVASSRVNNSAPKSTPKSRITDAQVETSKKMFPNMTDSEIRKELEKYIK